MAGVTEQRGRGLAGTRLASEPGKDALLAAFLFCCVAVAVARARQPSGDWSFFVAAGEQLFSGDWRSVYVDHPDAQTGPITLALAWLFDPLGLAFVRLMIMLSALGVLGMLLFDTRGLRDIRWRLGIGGIVLSLWWPQLSFYGHLDDAVVLVAAVGAVLLVRRDREWAVALLAGLAVAVKPTAVFMLAFTVPRTEWRRWAAWRPTAFAALVALLLWAPFVVGNTATLQALRPRMEFHADSVAALFGLEGGAPSGAYRAAQLLVVLGLSVYVAVRNGATGVLLTAVASRMLLDPAAWPYYTTSFVAGALVWDCYERESKVPWTTVAGGTLLAPDWLVKSDLARAALRLVTTAGAVAVVITHPRSRAAASRRR